MGFEELTCLSRNCDYGVAVWNSFAVFMAVRTSGYTEDGVVKRPGMENLDLSENKRLSFCMNEVKINFNYQFIAFCPASMNSFIVKIKAGACELQQHLNSSVKLSHARCSGRMADDVHKLYSRFIYHQTQSTKDSQRSNRTHTLPHIPQHTHTTHHT